MGSDEPRRRDDKRVDSLGGHLRLRAGTRLHPKNVCCLYSLEQLGCVRVERERGEERTALVAADSTASLIAISPSTRIRSFQATLTDSGALSLARLISYRALLGQMPPNLHFVMILLRKAKTLGSPLGLGHVHRHELALCRSSSAAYRYANQGSECSRAPRIGLQTTVGSLTSGQGTTRGKHVSLIPALRSPLQRAEG